MAINIWGSRPGKRRPAGSGGGEQKPGSSPPTHMPGRMEKLRERRAIARIRRKVAILEKYNIPPDPDFAHVVRCTLPGYESYPGYRKDPKKRTPPGGDR